MTAVHYHNGSCFASVSCVNGSAVVASLLNEALYGSRLGTYDSNYPVCRHHISVANIYQFHSLLYILYLLAYLLYLSLHINDYLCDIEVLSL